MATMPVALVALALGAFGIGTTEFVIMGLLPDIADDFAVSIPTAGLLISGYALGVTVGGPVLTAVSTRFPRKTVLLALMSIFVVGNLIAAVAPSYAVLMTGRVVSALSHGAFFGVGSVVAANLVAPDKKARAVALMFTGVTTANVLGVPAGSFIGAHLGWRATFWVVSVIGVVALIGLAALVPHQPRDANVRLRGELRAFRRSQVLLALAMTVLGYGGVFASFAYIAPMMTHVAGFSSGAVTWLLVVFGVGLVIGNLVGGRLADRALMPSVYGLLSGLIVILVVFAFTSTSKVGSVVTILALGAFGFGTVPPLQTRVLNKAREAPALASSANIGAFNLGNALGPWLSGLVISAGLGYSTVNLVGAALSISGLVVAVVAGLLDRQAPAESAVADPVLASSHDERAGQPVER